MGEKKIYKNKLRYKHKIVLRSTASAPEKLINNKRSRSRCRKKKKCLLDIKSNKGFLLCKD